MFADVPKAAAPSKASATACRTTSGSNADQGAGCSIRMHPGSTASPRPIGGVVTYAHAQLAPQIIPAHASPVYGRAGLENRSVSIFRRHPARLSREIESRQAETLRHSTSSFSLMNDHRRSTRTARVLLAECLAQAFEAVPLAFCSHFFRLRL